LENFAKHYSAGSLCEQYEKYQKALKKQAEAEPKVRPTRKKYMQAEVM
jgi:hypothetical protein